MPCFLEFEFLNLPGVHNPWENVPSKFLQPVANFKRQGPGRSVFLLIFFKARENSSLSLVKNIMRIRSGVG